MSRAKVRVGILLDDVRQAAWVCRMFETINKSNYAEIVLVVNANSDDSSFKECQQTLIHKMLLAVQRGLVGKPGYVESALASISSTELLTGIPGIEAMPRQGRAGNCVDANGQAQIQDFNLDVLVQFGSWEVSQEIMAATRCGVWSLEFGSYSGGDCVPPGYWEVMDSRSVTRSRLRIRTADSDQGRIAVQSFSSTNVMSIEDNASNVLWKSLHFVPRKLRELHRGGEQKFLEMLGDDPPYTIEDGSKYSAMQSDWRLAKLLCFKAWQKFCRKWHDVFYVRQWFLLYDFGQNKLTDVGRFKRLMPPIDRFWADPFLVYRDGKHYVFFEECLLPDGKGFISVLELHNDGVIAGPTPVLEKEYHLSYPFLLDIDGELYMIPETGKNRTVELYKCAEFPHKWEFQKNLMADCSVVDATLLEWDGLWWMFANSAANPNASTWDELHLFYGDSPFADNWTPHPKNPIVSDVRSSRPAGRIMIRDGRIYRPSQNSSRHYGYGLNICEITKMTETEYEEKIVSTIKPDWAKDIVSVHTINHEHGLTLIDGQCCRRK
jgi:hypothetical protein